MRYWYFTYYLTCPNGYEQKADATISSLEKYFPIGDVFNLFREDFDEDINLTILNVIEISETDFDYLSKELENDVCDM